MDFYITLPSNGGGPEFNPTNSNTSYKIRLPHRILLKDDDWEVAMVSISFPIRDHHKHHMLSRFPRGKIVAKIGAKLNYNHKTDGVTEYRVEGLVRIEDVTDPNTQSDVSPVKSGMIFVRHLVFALEKAIQEAALKEIKDDSNLTAGWFGDGDSRRGKQTFEFTDHGSVIIDGADMVVTPDIYVSLRASLAEHMGIVAPGTANLTNVEGRNIRHVSRSQHLQTGNFRTIETDISVHQATDFIELHNQVNWEIVGLDSGWFEQVFNAKYRVVRIFSNVCDSSVVGTTRTNVLAEAKVDAVKNEGQEYYEPVHLRYVPVRQRELDVIEIKLDDLNGHIVNLGVGVTLTVLHFKRAIKSG